MIVIQIPVNGTGRLSDELQESTHNTYEITSSNSNKDIQVYTFFFPLLPLARHHQEQINNNLICTHPLSSYHAQNLKKLNVSSTGMHLKHSVTHFVSYDLVSLMTALQLHFYMTQYNEALKSDVLQVQL